MNQTDDERYLLEHGWKRCSMRKPWEWHRRPYLGAYYTLKDAMAVQRAEERAGSVRSQT